MGYAGTEPAVSVATVAILKLCGTPPIALHRSETEELVSDQPPIMGSMASTIPMPRAASTGNAQMCVYLYRMAHLPTRRYG